MGRTPHDTLGKCLLKAALERVGTAETSREVAGEVQSADVWYVPDPSRAGHRSALGLLGWLASRAAIFEPFSGTPSASEVRACLLKLYQLHAEQGPAARRDRRGRDPRQPHLVLLVPSASERSLQTFGAMPVPGRQGVFSLAAGFCTLITVADRLPGGVGTLWLRLLGRGETQREAVSELLALPLDHPVRALAEREVVRWRTETTDRKSRESVPL